MKHFLTTIKKSAEIADDLVSRLLGVPRKNTESREISIPEIRDMSPKNIYL